jgi:hypothetical protein
MLISALFRDYAFLTSAYILEPVDLEFRRTGVYSTGRNFLIKELAVPLKKLADARRCDSFWFLTLINDDLSLSLAQWVTFLSWNTPASTHCRIGHARIQMAPSNSTISSLSELSKAMKVPRKASCT